MKFSAGLLVLLVPSVVSRRLGGKTGKSRGGGGLFDDGEAQTFTAPHEVHQYEQTKFYDEPEWECEFAAIQGVVGCLKCGNPRGKYGDALIVEVKAMYKRVDFNVKDEDLDPPRKHCVFPGRGEFWTCFNSNLVIEPDTDWLDAVGLKDKPLYNADGTLGGDQCYPGSLAGDIAENGATYPY